MDIRSTLHRALCLALASCAWIACSSEDTSGGTTHAGSGGSTSAGGSGGGAGSSGGTSSGGSQGSGGSTSTGGSDPGGSQGTGGESTDDAGENGGGGQTGGDAAPGGNAIQYVFVVLEENHEWSTVKNVAYLKHLVQIGAHSEQYFNPKDLHPSEPNYMWLEAGDNFGLGADDDDPSSSNLIKGKPHLVKLLDQAGVSWMSYQEDMEPGTCPISSTGDYAAKHDPFIFFDDVAGNPPSASNKYCADHHRPMSQFLADLKAGKVARYNFITPNLVNDMHDGSPALGGDWLQTNIDPIINKDSPDHNPDIYAHAALFVLWDEGDAGDGPIGMLIASPFAKVGYADTTQPSDYYYTHSSLLLTLQKIFGVASTPLGDAAKAKDLAEFFTTFP
jgi:hypothetical protein